MAVSIRWSATRTRWRPVAPGVSPSTTRPCPGVSAGSPWTTARSDACARVVVGREALRERLRPLGTGDHALLGDHAVAGGDLALGAGVRDVSRAGIPAHDAPASVGRQGARGDARLDQLLAEGDRGLLPRALAVEQPEPRAVGSTCHHMPARRLTVREHVQGRPPVLDQPCHAWTARGRLDLQTGVLGEVAREVGDRHVDEDPQPGDRSHPVRAVVAPRDDLRRRVGTESALQHEHVAHEERVGEAVETGLDLGAGGQRILQCRTGPEGLERQGARRGRARLASHPHARERGQELADRAPGRRSSG